MLLTLDITEAFNRVIPAWLLHSLKEKKIHERIVKWVSSFISNRTTILCLPGWNTKAFPICSGIRQGSSLPLILFLFYNTNLVNACNIPTAQASGIGFVYDVNALALSESTENNCRMLLSLHCYEVLWPLVPMSLVLCRVRPEWSEYSSVRSCHKSRETLRHWSLSPLCPMHVVHSLVLLAHNSLLPCLAT
jgi:hypothetical protein